MDCQYQQSLGAYYDGELSGPRADEIARHLEHCPTCAAELREMAEVSDAFGGFPGRGMSSIGRARAHRAADEAANRAQGASLVRTAGILGGLAASILIVASAWLLESPGSAPPAPARVAAAPRPTPEWERVAMTLDAGPLAPEDQPMLADAQLADWMVRNLK